MEKVVKIAMKDFPHSDSDLENQQFYIESRLTRMTATFSLAGLFVGALAVLCILYWATGKLGIWQLCAIGGTLVVSIWFIIQSALDLRSFIEAVQAGIIMSAANAYEKGEENAKSNS